MNTQPSIIGTDSGPPAQPITGPGRAAMQISQDLPLALVSVLERRYLSNFRHADWQLDAPEHDDGAPLLCEVTALGRPAVPGEWSRAMPRVLSACHESGHALVMALHGQGEWHRLYLGARRVPGAGAGSTEDYLEQVRGAFGAAFTGLQLTAVARRLDHENLPEMADFLAMAPALAAITGIPSGGRVGASSLPGLDHLVRAVGDHRYVLMIIAEPLEVALIEHTLDVCRRLRGEIHATPRRVLRRHRDRREERSSLERATREDWSGNAAFELQRMMMFCQMLGMPVLGAAVAVSPWLTGYQADLRRSSEELRRASDAETWSEQDSVELIDATVEACETLLARHVERLQAGRSGGWWRTAVYIAGEGEAARHAVAGALRSLCSGDTSALDPIRIVPLPPHRLREAIARGQVLRLQPAGGGPGHPLGEPYEALGTCINSDELAVLVNLPQQEIPGLPMRDHESFALTPPEPGPSAIALGTLQDSAGRDLGRLTITAEALNRHVFVTGATGYGKTNTCMKLLVEAYTRLGVPFLVIEPAKSEYRRLAGLPELRRALRVYSIGGDSPLPFRLNPLAPVLDTRGRPAVSLVGHVDRLRAIFNASFTMYGGMPQVLEQALLEVYLERGWDLYTSENTLLGDRRGLDDRPIDADEAAALMPCLQDLYDQIDSVLVRKGYSPMVRQDVSAVLRSRLGSLMRGNKGLMLNSRRSIDLEHLFNAPTVIELQELRDDEDKAFVMAQLFILLSEYAEVRHRTTLATQRGMLRHLTLIEEAHRLLEVPRGTAMAGMGDPRGKAVSMFTDMLAEMRAYGEGFLIADQIPTKLAPETMKNSNLKIVHRLIAPDDRQAAGTCLNLDERQVRHLNNLTPGLALVHDERVGAAALVCIDNLKDDQAPDLADEEVIAILRSTHGERRDGLRRHAGCESCPDPCVFYRRIESAADRRARSRALRPFLESLLIGLDVTLAWADWSRWRGSWTDRAEAMRGTDGPAATGITFCAAVQAAYLWLGQILADRGKVRSDRPAVVTDEPQVPTTPRPWFQDYAPDEPQASGVAKKSSTGPLATSGPVPEEPLSPADRIRRERSARALGRLFRAWIDADVLDDRRRTLYHQAHDRLMEDLASEPPHDDPPVGCRCCPARCQLLPFVTPHLATVRRTLEASATAETGLPVTGTEAEDRLRTHMNQVHLLSGRSNNDPLRRQWLYCLLTNLDPALDPDAGGPLAALRQPAGADNGKADTTVHT